MSESKVSLPVRCRRCGVVTLVEFPTVVVVTALTRWNQLALHSHCHDEKWDASAAEIQAIRDYVGHDWVEANRGVE